MTAAPVPVRRDRLPLLLLFWSAILVLGFAAVLVLGRALPTSEDRLAAAYAPETPVTEQTALASAETIIRIEYPSLIDGERTISRRTDFGVDRWLIVYSDPEALAAVRISIEVESGEVALSYLP